MSSLGSANEPSRSKAISGEEESGPNPSGGQLGTPLRCRLGSRAPSRSNTWPRSARTASEGCRSKAFRHTQINLRGEAHLVRKGRSEKTIESYRHHVERLFADWLDTPLRELAADPSSPAWRESTTRSPGRTVLGVAFGHLFGGAEHGQDDFFFQRQRPNGEDRRRSPHRRGSRDMGNSKLSILSKGIEGSSF